MSGNNEDNTQLNLAHTLGSIYRDIAKKVGDRFIKTQVVTLDVNAEGTESLLSADNPLPIRFETDSPNFDAFARLRISNPITLFDSKLIHNNNPLFWDDQQVSGGSTTSTWSQNTASVVMGVAATTAGNRTRQTFMRFNYRPGKSQMVMLTAVIDKSGGGAGIERGIGYGDDNNGIFLVDSEGTYVLRKRSYVTGSIVDTDVSQASWNLDTMDGNGASGITLDFSKAQIFFMDMEWLGVGRVRCGFVIDGIPIYVHQFLHANSISNVYISTPNLPVRYWIDNDGTGAASTIEHICSTVISEGGENFIGNDFSKATGSAFINANTIGTYYAIFGIRLKSVNLDGVVKLSNAFALAATSDDYYWEIRLDPTVAGSPTWSDLTNSVVQTASGDTTNNPSTTTVTGGAIVASGYIKSGVQAGSTRGIVDNIRHIGSHIDGTPEEAWLVVTPLTANLDIYGGLGWREIS